MGPELRWQDPVLGTSAFPAGTGKGPLLIGTQRRERSQITEPRQRNQGEMRIREGSIVRSITKHQSVVEIVFRESEGAARHRRVLCMTMKPEAAPIKNRVRKAQAVAARQENAVFPRRSSRDGNSLVMKHKENGTGSWQRGAGKAVPGPRLAQGQAGSLRALPPAERALPGAGAGGVPDTRGCA